MSEALRCTVLGRLCAYNTEHPSVDEVTYDYCFAAGLSFMVTEVASIRFEQV